MRFSELVLVVAILGLTNVRVARAQGGFGGGGFGGGGFGGGFGGNNGGNNGGGDNNDDGGNDDDNNNNALALDQNNVQDASQSTGQDGGGDPGQADSQTDDANFINFCSGETLTNGQQVQGGSCNGIVMGKIPAQNQMVSSMIISPQPGQDIEENQDFDIQVQMANLAAGSFTNPDNTYYAAPQDLDDSGQIIGHTHVTVQDMGGSMTPNQALDASQFAFFKGINDDGNGQGLLSATVDGGLPAGVYRVCTMSSSSNHQPVLMPVAQRGAQDDCTKFTVGQGNNNNNNNNNQNNQNNGGNNGGFGGFGGGGFGGGGFGSGKGVSGGGFGGFGGFGRRVKRFSERAFVA